VNTVIIGGGGALAQHLIARLLKDRQDGDWLTAVCRRTMPDEPGYSRGGRTWFEAVTDVSQVNPLPVDVLITMPGCSYSGKMENVGPEHWQTVVEDNLLSVGRALTALLPKMRDGGRVVVVGSVVGRAGGYGCGPYAAAKAGLVGLVRAAANESAARGVCVNLLELGYVNCGMGARLPMKVKAAALDSIPLRRFAEPAEAVEAILFLSRVRYMTGGVFPLTGGL